MAERATIRLLLVDDHPVLRAGLGSLLAIEPDLVVVGQADNGQAAIDAWPKVRPDVALVDLFMEGIDGVETIRRIREIDPAARVIVLSSSDSREDAGLAIAAGARGFVSKTVGHEEIVAAIREVHAGATGVQRGVRADPLRPQSELLSPREMEALVHLRHGSTYAEIARAMSISERTAKWHVTGILTKLNVHDRAAAVARAFDLGLLKVARPVH
jgi:two-component system NarL family response regulator